MVRVSSSPSLRFGCGQDPRQAPSSQVKGTFSVSHAARIAGQSPRLVPRPAAAGGSEDHYLGRRPLSVLATKASISAISSGWPPAALRLVAITAAGLCTTVPSTTPRLGPRCRRQLPSAVANQFSSSVTGNPWWSDFLAASAIRCASTASLTPAPVSAPPVTASRNPMTSLR
jgi:hypothetical protein